MNRCAQLARTGILSLAAVTWGAQSSFASAPDHGHAEPAAKSSAPAPAASANHDDTPEAVAPDAALKLLVDGNRRFVDAATEGLRRDDTRRCETTVGGQHPFAAVLSCADSRVPAELVFDQGIGDLFVVRVAGNVADTDEIGTIEYGVDHLGTRLVVVLGHTKCGAVTAVVNSNDSHGSAHGAAPLSPNLAGLLDNIAPAAEKARKNNPQLKGNALVAAAIRLNVMRSIEDLLAHSDSLRVAAQAGKIKLVGGVYDIHSGIIDWLGPHPTRPSCAAPPPPTPGPAKAYSRRSRPS
jgi:carbonic anhydrase